MATPSKEVELKDKEIVRLMVNGTGQTEALKSVGYSDSTIACQAPKIVKRAFERFREALIRAGIDEDFLAQKIASGITSSSRHVVLSKDGIHTDTVTVPDEALQEKYLTNALKIHGAFAAQDVDININAPEAMLERIAQRRLQRQNSEKVIDVESRDKPEQISGE